MKDIAPNVSTAEPELTYRGLDYCDGCGAPLAPRERLSGLCRACSKPTKRLEPHEREPDR
jgi:predicted amidophosphoribosyltransferase